NPELAAPRSWLIKRNLAGGGPMLDFGCHRIEVLMNLFGPIHKTKALRTNALFGREVEGTAVAMFEVHERIVGALSVTHAAAEPNDTLQIFGSGGSIHVPILNTGSMRIVTREAEREESHPPAANFHYPLIEDFVGAVLDNREPRVGGEIGKAVAEVEDQIY